MAEKRGIKGNKTHGANIRELFRFIFCKHIKKIVK